MTPKEFLRQYSDADTAISAKLDQIAKLRALATKTTAVLSPDPVHTGYVGDRVSSIVAKIVDLEKEVDTEIDQLGIVKRKVLDVITKVQKPKQRAVLIRRYINGQTWERIAVDLNISYQWVCELHGQALLEIEKIFSALDSN